MEKKSEVRRIPTLAARASRLKTMLTGQARQDLIEEIVKHVEEARAGSPLDAAKALSRLGILTGEARNTPEGDDEMENE